MPRAAGSGTHYEIAVLDAGKRPVGHPILLPSVTTILGVLKKGGLDWWGHKIGVTGTLDLLLRGELDAKALAEMPLELAAEQIYETIKKEAVHTPAAQLSGAGTRGTNLHDVAENLLKTGSMPKPETVPLHLHGYLRAMAGWYSTKWFTNVRETELPVFSLTHRYAGTLDGLVEVDTSLITEFIGATEGIDARHAVIDFKTNKKGEVYDSHLLQVTAYGAACVEMGLLPAMPLGIVVAFGEQGNFKQVMSRCTIDQFLTVKSAWETVEQAKDLVKTGVLSPSTAATSKAGKKPAKATQKGEADG